MRILLATDWNRGRGGAEAYLSWLRAGLAAAGDDVRLLTSSAGSAGDGSAEYVAYGTERRAAQAFLQIVNPFAVARARQALREFRPEVALVNMFAHHLSPAFLHALAGVPIVLVVSDYKCICPIGVKLLPDGTRCEVRAGVACLRSACVGPLHWLRDRPRYALIDSALRRARRVVSCSDLVRLTLASEGIESETILLPVPMPGAAYRRAPAADPTFLFVGRLDVEKGVPLLLRAFSRLRREVPSARLRVVGRGPLRPELDRLASELGLDDAVTFVGWLDPPEVEAEIARAWALVAPSLNAEPLGLVAPEAIVRGVPVVASRFGGFAETVVEGASGLLYANGDEIALGECLLSIATGASFPTLAVDAQVVADAARRHAIGAHVERIRAVLRDAVADPDPAVASHAGA